MTAKKKSASRSKKNPQNKKIVLGHIGNSWMELAKVSADKLNNALQLGQEQGYKLGFHDARINYYHYGYIALAAVLGLLAGVCL